MTARVMCSDVAVGRFAIRLFRCGEVRVAWIFMEIEVESQSFPER